MNTISLNEWKVMGSMPYQADFSKWIQKGIEAPNMTAWIPATVPGSIYTDLQAFGYIDDPYFELNSLHCEWVANRWWTYKSTFDVTECDLKDTLKLTFKGIDYAAQIYLNGHKLGSHEGMYIPFETVINKHAVLGENTLVCVIEHAPFADAQPGYTSTTKFMKARFNYKWDFATRLVNLGLYDDVMITKHKCCSILHSFVRPIKQEHGFKIAVEVELFGYCEAETSVQICSNILTNNGIATIDKSYDFKVKAGYNTFCTCLQVDDPKLWFPNGYGEQILNDITITIVDSGAVSDSISHKVGFRTLEYIHAKGRTDALPYCIVINGKRIFIKGSNLVPLCHMQGAITQNVLAQKLQAAKDCNINLFRIWGGGHIESEAFYTLCDQFGIMVFQEFTMSSSGCDDVPSKNPHFLELLHKVAVHNIKLKRNHVSLTYWSGGNELTDSRYLDSDDHEGHPATFEDSTLAMLKGLVDTLSPDVRMLPSSASGPNALLKVGDIGNNHDVHGPWGYVGAYEHYDFYNNSDSIVHGEFGCGGISNLDTLKRFISVENQKLATSHENKVWHHHSSGWDSYSMREQFMFGSLRDIPFEEYIKVNQYVQAESLRYSLEANRRRQWSCVGQMTWQFNEPWPNIQCSNVLDYYGGKKLAYYFMADAYKSVLTSLKYHRLFFSGGEVFDAEVSIINDKKTADYTIDISVITSSGNVLLAEQYSGIAAEDVCTSVATISITLPVDITGGFSVILTTKCGEFEEHKEYLLLIADKEIPVTMLPQEEKIIQAFHQKRPAGLDRKRADYKIVLDYVNRYEKNI